MAIKIGNKNISTIKYGTKDISRVYMGSKQVFPELKETLIAVLDYTLYGDLPWTDTKRISYSKTSPEVSGSTTTTFTYDGIKYENTVAWSFDLLTKDITITYNNSEPQTLQLGQSYAFEANNPHNYKTLITYTSYDEGANKFVLTINEEYKEQAVTYTYSFPNMLLKKGPTGPSGDTWTPSAFPPVNPDDTYLNVTDTDEYYYKGVKMAETAYALIKAYKKTFKVICEVHSGDDIDTVEFNNETGDKRCSTLTNWGCRVSPHGSENDYIIYILDY